MTAQFATLDALAHEITEMGSHTAEYWAKQVHQVPKSTVVDRNTWLVEQATKKVVLHIGCTGALDTALLKVATKCYGFDALLLDRKDFMQVNCDQVKDHPLPICEGVQLIVCGEVLEHLSNPGYFLDALKVAYPGLPVILTVPNAFSAGGQEWLLTRGRENVNADHVCYYSYTTLKELLRRAGYAITRFAWYHGKPYVAEGLIVEAIPA